MLKRADREEMLRKLMDRAKRQGRFEGFLADAALREKNGEAALPKLVVERVNDTMVDNQAWIESLYQRLLNDE